ncbi:MAG: hypothetical protein K9K37_08750 [Desulfocapsa sp.]|nr:hypothetical protein [Desulfocapsa sp.]
MFNPQLTDCKASTWIDFVTNVDLTLPGQDLTVSGHTENLSIFGLVMQPLLPEEYFDAGVPCTVKIILHGERSNLVIDELAGEVVSCDDQGVSVRFKDRLEWYALFHVFEKKVNRMMAYDL